MTIYRVYLRVFAWTVVSSVLAMTLTIAHAQGVHEAWMVIG